MRRVRRRCAPVRLLAATLALAAVLPAGVPAAVDVDPTVGRALDRLYNFDFEAAHEALDGHVREQPDDPIGYAIRGAVYLFYELDRLGILATEFFRDDEKIIDRKRLQPDPEIYASFVEVLDRAETLALARLEESPDDTTALFALCLKEGLVSDYKALIEKRGLKSLRYARTASLHAIRLLELEPRFYDAYLATGITEYLIGSLPFFIRWFVRFEGVEGDKDVAFDELQMVADEGRYLGPFAKILLSVMSLREGRPEQARLLLDDLTTRFPENPLLRRELNRLNQELSTPGR